MTVKVIEHGNFILIENVEGHGRIRIKASDVPDLVEQLILTDAYDEHDPEKEED